MRETTIVPDLRHRLVKQGERVSHLDEKTTHQMAQLRQTLVELREAGAELRALRREAQTR